MRRKPLLIIITIAAVLCLVVLFVINPDIFRKKGKATPILALPESSLFFYKGKDFLTTYKQFANTNYWKDFLRVTDIQKTDSILQVIFRKLQAEKSLFDQFQNDETVISIHQTSPKNVHPLIIIHTRGKTSYEKFATFLKPDVTGKLLERTYKGVKIFDFQLDTRKSQLAFAIVDNLLIASSYPLLIEDAITTLKRNRIQNNYLFSEVSGNKPNVNFYINYRQFGTFLNMFTDQDYKPVVSEMDNFGGLGSYELTFYNDYLFLRGNLSNTDSSKNYLTLFQGQTAGKITVQRILSAQTSVLLAHTIDNFSLFYSKPVERVRKQGNIERFESKIKGVENKYNISVENDILPLLDGPFALAVNEMLTVDITRSMTVLLKITDAEKAMQVFYKPSTAIDTFKTGLIEKYREFDIYGSQLSEVFPLLFGHCYQGIKNTYYTVIREYFVFCPDLAHLHSVIDDYLAQKVLETSAGFTKLSDKIGSESNMLLYINPVHCTKMQNLFINDAWIEPVENNFEYFKKFEFLAFQISNSSSGIYSEIVAKYSQASTVLEGGTIWETKLDTNYVSKPFIVKNHNTKANEIVVFDALNQMYLIDAGGRIIWKRKLESALVGDIYQVDYFDNDKLQYLFATEKNIQLLDRNGLNVANFPIKLQARSSTGLTMFNFSSNNNFIFFAGCANNTVYGYAKSGKFITGWAPKRIKGSLSMPMKYFIHNNKTYYLGVSASGVFYIWSTRGEDVMKPLDLKTSFKNPFYMIASDEFSKIEFISVDTNGKCFFVSPTSKCNIQQLGKWSSAVDFEYFDHNNDGKKELVIAEGNNVAFFSPEGKALMSIILDNPIKDIPTYITIRGKNYIAYLNNETQSVFLVDYEGNIYRNFPVSCQSRFVFYDLNGDNNMELIGGRGNTIFLSRF